MTLTNFPDMLSFARASDAKLVNRLKMAFFLLNLSGMRRLRNMMILYSTLLDPSTNKHHKFH